MRFAIVFHGQLKPGVSQTQTIAILQRITKLDKATVSARFFSGKPVKVKIVEEETDAKAFQKKLENAGLLVKVHALKASDAAKHHNTSPEQKAAATPTEAQPDATKQKQPRIALWATLSLSVLLLVGMTVVSFWLHSVLKPTTHEIVKQAENALFSEDTVVLGHINVQKLANIEQIVASLTGDTAIPLNQMTWAQELNDVGIVPKRDIGDIVFAYNYDEQLGAYPAWILSGTFNKQQIDQYLAKHYETEAVTTTSTPHTLFRKQDINTCEYSTLLAMVAKNGLMIVTHPKHISKLAKKLKNPSDDATITPAAWRDYRAQHLASAALLNPQVLNKMTRGMARMMLSGISGETSPLEQIFVGFKGNTLPPRFTAQILANVKDPAWVAMIQPSIETQVEQMQSQNKGSKIAGLLTQNLSTTFTENSVAAQLTIDRPLVNALQDAVNQGLSTFMSFGAPSGNSKNLPEQIDEEATSYQTEVASFDLEDWQPESGEVPTAIAGPFAIDIKSLRQTAEGLVEIELTAQIKDIPNLANTNPLGAFSITQVNDHSGDNILRVETCGPSRNHEPAAFEKGFFNTLEATKTIRLKPGKTLADIAVIQGSLNLPVATQTNIMQLGTPISDKVIKHQGNTLTINQATGSTLNYTIGANHSTLLSVRALNQNKQVLRGAGSFSTGGGDSTKTVNASINGNIAYVEVVHADTFKNLSNTFTLNKALPQTGVASTGDPWQPPAAFSQPSWPAFLKAAETLAEPDTNNGWLGEALSTTKIGPGWLAVYAQTLQNWFDGTRLQGNIGLTLPQLDALETFHPLTQLHLKNITFDNGQSMDVDYSVRAPQFSKPFSSSPADGGSHISTTFAYQINLGKDAVDESAQVEALAGYLSIDLPTELSVETLSLTRLGTLYENNEFSLTLAEWTNSRLAFIVKGDASKLASIALLNANGVNTQMGYELRDPNPFDQNLSIEEDALVKILDVKLTSQPVKSLMLVLAQSSSRYQFPYQLFTRQE